LVSPPFLIPIQLFFGHLCGGYVNTYQPSKMAAIEGRWNDEETGWRVLFAWPDVENRRNLFAIHSCRRRLAA